MATEAPSEQTPTTPAEAIEAPADHQLTADQTPVEQATTEQTETPKVKQPRAKKEKAAPKPKKLSAIDAAAKVLAEATQPMNCHEMIEAMTKKGESLLVYVASLSGKHGDTYRRIVELARDSEWRGLHVFFASELDKLEGTGSSAK